MASKIEKTGGYNIEFVKALDSRYKCPICSFALRIPFQTLCGHRFCESCIKQTIESGPKTCPVDGSSLTFEQIFRDAFCNREILQLECYCSRKSQGCKWTGQLRKIGKEHGDECPFIDLVCPNDGCDVKIQRKLLQKHATQDCRFKKIICQYCGTEIQEQLLVKHQDEECAKIKLPCPKQCGLTVEREHMESHIAQECENAEAHCPYLFGGCPFEATRANLKKHLQENILEHAYMEETQFTNFRRQFQLLSNDFVKQRNDQMQIWDLVQATHSSVQTHYVKITMLETTSYDGEFIWKIEEVTRRIEEAVSGKTLSFYSTPFYVGRFGYKVCARVYLNGEGMGKGTHVSLFFVVMRSQHDALLPWPFQQKVSFKLIDQTGGDHIVDSFRPDRNSSSFQRPTSNMNIASGCPIFVPKSVFFSRGYIKEDTLFFKITVETTGIPHF